ADDAPDLVIEDLGGSPRQRAEAFVLQPRQKRRDWNSERCRALADLERRERMDMHPRHGGTNGADDVDVGLSRVFRMDAALQADLGGTARPGLRASSRDLREVEIVRLAAQRLVRLVLRERAEPAAIAADIGVIDVAVDDVAHDVAADSAT